MISTKNLCKYFDDFLAVSDVNLEISSGEVLALLGPNGAGKTTTVRMLTSVLVPSSGSARIAGYDVVTQASQVRASVGVLTENHGLYNRMPAQEYLDFFGQLYKLHPYQRQKRIRFLLEQFNLYGERNKAIGAYSKGMRQKLALARALLHDPPVLLLDEPTSAMDPESARLVRNSIEELRSAERAIIICTHNLAEAEELADQIAIIQHGRIIALGTPSDLKAQLLGPSEYEIRFGETLNGKQPIFMPGVHYVGSGENWLRIQIEDPLQINPVVLRRYLEQGFMVISLQEVPRSLEQVYLQAINASNHVSAPITQ